MSTKVSAQSPAQPVTPQPAASRLSAMLQPPTQAELARASALTSALYREASVGGSRVAGLGEAQQLAQQASRAPADQALTEWFAASA